MSGFAHNLVSLAETDDVTGTRAHWNAYYRAKISPGQRLLRLLLAKYCSEHIKKFAARVRLGMSFPILFATVELAAPTSFISKTHGACRALETA